jgi:hypothetical protein
MRSVILTLIRSSSDSNCVIWESWLAYDATNGRLFRYQNVLRKLA